MAQFKASLIDPTTQEASIVLDADCSQLQITDSSNYTQFVQLTGTIAVTNGLNIVNGTGTLFLTELSPTDVISIAGVQFTVLSITNNELMALTITYPLVSAIGLDLFLREQEGAHDAADFSGFIKIIVSDQGGDVFTFTNFIDPATSLLDGDELIATPSATPNITVNFDITTGDGVYQITLCSIPTYDVAENYQTGDTVFFNNLLYEAIANSIGNPPDLSPLLWEEVELEDVSAKYCTFEKVVVQCDLNQCFDDSTREAFCTLKEHVCDDSMLCKNERFLKALKLLIILEDIENMNQRGAYNDIEDAITLSKTICQCC